MISRNFRLETGGSGTAESLSEIVKSLNAKNAFLRQKKDRLEADNRKGLQHNKDLKQANEVEQQKHEMTVLRLEQETERDAMRLQQDKARLQHEVEQLRLLHIRNFHSNRIQLLPNRFFELVQVVKDTIQEFI